MTQGSGEPVDIPPDVDQHLATHHRTFMVTRRKDGSPTCHPMAQWYSDGRMFLNMYAASQKHKNLVRDDRICCLVATDSDIPEMQVAVVKGRARQLSIEETLAPDAATAIVAARGIGMEGVKAVEDAPEKFQIEEPEDWLKRAGIMVARIRDRVRVIWEVEPDQPVRWLGNLRKG
jgi:Pyridoxamine 5'-phosphate oxidase